MRMNLFGYGFRPLFLLSGLAAMVFIPAWALSFVAGTALGSGWPPTLWHGHEMLFGFISSAVAGFLLTAVPSWTGQKGYAGAPLAALAALWLAARVLIASSALWPPVLVAATDLAFLPYLGILVAVPLLRSRSRNTPLLAVLTLLWLSNLAFHVALLRGDAPLARHALLLGIDLMLILVTVIGGRIVPAFTASALRQAGSASVPGSRSWLTALAVVSMVAVAVGDLGWSETPVAGALAGVAALVQGARLAQWKSLQTRHQPIVWILHLAYALAARGPGPEGRRTAGRLCRCRVLAPRADDRRACDHDPGGDDARRARTHRPGIGGASAHDRRLRAADAGRTGQGVRVHDAPAALSAGDHSRRGAVDRIICTLRSGLRTHPVGPACRRQAGLAARRGAVLEKREVSRCSDLPFFASHSRSLRAAAWRVICVRPRPSCRALAIRNEPAVGSSRVDCSPHAGVDAVIQRALVMPSRNSG